MGKVKRSICAALSVVFFLTSTGISRGQTISGAVLMPEPGSMASLSGNFTPAHLVGLTIDSQNAFKFDVIIHKGDVPLTDEQKKDEYRELVKYFLAALTVSDDKQWVNLSPYEGNRIIDDSFGLTGMGRDLLAQDYILKQLTASLMHPDSELGKKFWSRIYEKVYAKYGTTDVPVDTFNKIWIMPDKATVFEKGESALIVSSHLKVMTERDYLSLENNAIKRESGVPVKQDETAQLSSEVVKEIILPQIEREVNEGKNFANLRQIVSAMILATWYKKALKESLLGKVYADRAKVKGLKWQEAGSFKQEAGNGPASGFSLQTSSPDEIWQQYVQAFKKGAFNFIKEDYDKYTEETLPRRYFSGGFKNSAMVNISHEPRDAAQVQDAAQGGRMERVSISVDPAATKIAPAASMVRAVRAVAGVASPAMLRSQAMVPSGTGKRLLSGMILAVGLLGATGGLLQAQPQAAVERPASSAKNEEFQHKVKRLATFVILESSQEAVQIIYKVRDEILGKGQDLQGNIDLFVLNLLLDEVVANTDIGERAVLDGLVRNLLNEETGIRDALGKGNDGTPYARAQQVLALSLAKETPEKKAAMLKALSDDDARVRWAAAAFGFKGVELDTTTVAALLGQLEREQAPRVREKILFILMRSEKNAEAGKAVSGMLQQSVESDAGVRKAAWKYVTDKALPGMSNTAVEVISSDNSPEVRAQALLYLAVSNKTNPRPEILSAVSGALGSESAGLSSNEALKNLLKSAALFSGNADIRKAVGSLYKNVSTDEKRRLIIETWGEGRTPEGVEFSFQVVTANGPTELRIAAARNLNKGFQANVDFFAGSEGKERAAVLSGLIGDQAIDEPLATEIAETMGLYGNVSAAAPILSRAFRKGSGKEFRKRAELAMRELTENRGGLKGSAWVDFVLRSSVDLDPTTRSLLERSVRADFQMPIRFDGETLDQLLTTREAPDKSLENIQFYFYTRADPNGASFQTDEIKDSLQRVKDKKIGAVLYYEVDHKGNPDLPPTADFNKGSLFTAVQNALAKSATDGQVTAVLPVSHSDPLNMYLGEGDADRLYGFDEESANFGKNELSVEQAKFLLAKIRAARFTVGDLGDDMTTLNHLLKDTAFGQALLERGLKGGLSERANSLARQLPEMMRVAHRDGLNPSEVRSLIEENFPGTPRAHYERRLTFNDTEFLSRIGFARLLSKNVRFLIIGCSAGQGQDREINIANFFKEFLLKSDFDPNEVRVFAFTDPASGFKIIYDKEGKVIEDVKVRGSTAPVYHAYLDIFRRSSGEPLAAVLRTNKAVPANRGLKVTAYYVADVSGEMQRREVSTLPAFSEERSVGIGLAQRLFEETRWKGEVDLKVSAAQVNSAMTIPEADLGGANQAMSTYSTNVRYDLPFNGGNVDFYFLPQQMELFDLLKLTPEQFVARAAERIRIRADNDPGFRFTWLNIRKIAGYRKTGHGPSKSEDFLKGVRVMTLIKPEFARYLSRDLLEKLLLESFNVSIPNIDWIEYHEVVDWVDLYQGLAPQEMAEIVRASILSKQPVPYFVGQTIQTRSRIFFDRIAEGFINEYLEERSRLDLASRKGMLEFIRDRMSRHLFGRFELDKDLADVERGLAQLSSLEDAWKRADAKPNKEMADLNKQLLIVQDALDIDPQNELFLKREKEIEGRIQEEREWEKANRWAFNVDLQYSMSRKLQTLERAVHDGDLLGASILLDYISKSGSITMNDVNRILSLIPKAALYTQRGVRAYFKLTGYFRSHVVSEVLELSGIIAYKDPTFPAWQNILLLSFDDNPQTAARLLTEGLPASEHPRIPAVLQKLEELNRSLLEQREQLRNASINAAYHSGMTLAEFMAGSQSSEERLPRAVQYFKLRYDVVLEVPFEGSLSPGQLQNISSSGNSGVELYHPTDVDVVVGGLEELNDMLAGLPHHLVTESITFRKVVVVKKTRDFFRASDHLSQNMIVYALGAQDHRQVFFHEWGHSLHGIRGSFAGFVSEERLGAAIEKYKDFWSGLGYKWDINDYYQDPGALVWKLFALLFDHRQKEWKQNITEKDPRKRIEQAEKLYGIKLFYEEDSKQVPVFSLDYVFEHDDGTDRDLPMEMIAEGAQLYKRHPQALQKLDEVLYSLMNAIVGDSNQAMLTDKSNALLMLNGKDVTGQRAGFQQDDSKRNDFRGGIDLNQANMDMQIKRDGNGVPLPVSQQDLEKIKFDGLVPRILSIQPVTHLPMLSEAAGPPERLTS